MQEKQQFKSQYQINQNKTQINSGQTVEHKLNIL